LLAVRPQRAGEQARRLHDVRCPKGLSFHARGITLKGMIRSHPRLLVVLVSLLAFPQTASASSPRKPPDELPSVKELPDPFTFNDGSKVKAPADWPKPAVGAR
jgi:hypothetical protein